MAMQYDLYFRLAAIFALSSSHPSPFEAFTLINTRNRLLFIWEVQLLRKLIWQAHLPHTHFLFLHAVTRLPIQDEYLTSPTPSRSALLLSSVSLYYLFSLSLGQEILYSRCHTTIAHPRVYKIYHLFYADSFPDRRYWWLDCSGCGIDVNPFLQMTSFLDLFGRWQQGKYLPVCLEFVAFWLG